MCIYPSYAFTEKVCDFCIAANHGQDLHFVLEDNGYDDDEFEGYTGHEICSVDWEGASPVLSPCACRNSEHRLADPTAMFERTLEAFKAAYVKEPA